MENNNTNDLTTILSSVIENQSKITNKILPKIYNGIIENNTYNINYENGDIQCIKPTNNITIVASPSNIPSGEAIILYTTTTDNFNINFEGKDLITLSGTYYTTFTNINNSIKVVGNPVKEF